MKKRGKKSVRKEKRQSRSRSSRYSSSDEDLERIKKGSKKKKWYSSDEYSSSADFSESEDENSSFNDEKRHRSRKTSKYEDADMSNSKKKLKSGKQKYGAKKSKDRGNQGDVSDSNLSGRFCYAFLCVCACVLYICVCALWWGLNLSFLLFVQMMVEPIP